ncbi:MAG: hypothetical protein Q8P44_00420 [Dehalococcoidia bacterium]|nr:hypothetical protein [Dehalococcoidia bacterium]
MKSRKKFIVIALAAVTVIAGSISGVAFAQSGGNGYGALIERAGQIYQENTGAALDVQALKDAFTQAQGEMREKSIQAQIEKGRITQEQADQFKAWQQAKPDTEQFRQGFEAWKQGKPGMPSLGQLRGVPAPRDAGEMLAKAAAILGKDEQTLKDALAQASREIQAGALQNRLNQLVEQGVITPEQANSYQTWLQSKPAAPEELKAWQEAKPDMPFSPKHGIQKPGRGPGRPGGHRTWGR